MVVDGILLKDEEADSEKKLAVADASVMIERALQQVRSISHLLHPPLLDEVGLISAIRWFLEGFTKRSRIKTTVDVQPKEFPRFQPEFETAVFRVVQEALNNVFRHSGASNSWVALKQRDGQLVVTVRDDGKGIDAGVVECRANSIGVGIGGMQQRLKQFGGELLLQNCNPGTLVEVSVPTKNWFYQEEADPAILKENVLAEAIALVPALSVPYAATAPRSSKGSTPQRLSP
jgi:signal transduction histidine kinase